MHGMHTKTLILKTVVFLVNLVFIAYAFYAQLTDVYSADPGKDLMLLFGKSSIVMFLINMGIAPVSRIHQCFSAIINLRATVGLWCFFYALMHVGLYVASIHAFDFTSIISEVFDLPYIDIGLVSFFIFACLAATSNEYSKKILQEKWFVLHKFGYLALVLAFIHWFIIVRSDYTQWFVCLTIAVMLHMCRYIPKKWLK